MQLNQIVMAAATIEQLTALVYSQIRQRGIAVAIAGDDELDDMEREETEAEIADDDW
jgi:hypothetical protein